MEHATVIIGMDANVETGPALDEHERQILGVSSMGQRTARSQRFLNLMIKYRCSLTNTFMTNKEPTRHPWKNESGAHINQRSTQIDFIGIGPGTTWREMEILKCSATVSDHDVVRCRVGERLSLLRRKRDYQSRWSLRKGFTAFASMVHAQLVGCANLADAATAVGMCAKNVLQMDPPDEFNITLTEVISEHWNVSACKVRALRKERGTLKSSIERGAE